MMLLLNTDRLTMIVHRTLMRAFSVQDTYGYLLESARIVVENLDCDPARFKSFIVGLSKAKHVGIRKKILSQLSLSVAMF